jgi:hypothetical protein
MAFRLHGNYTRAKLHINWPWAIGVDILDIRAGEVSYLDKPVPACFFSDEKPITVRPDYDLVIAYRYTGYCPHGFVIGSLFDLTFTVTPEKPWHSLRSDDMVSRPQGESYAKESLEENR